MFLGMMLLLLLLGCADLCLHLLKHSSHPISETPTRHPTWMTASIRLKEYKGNIFSYDTNNSVSKGTFGWNWSVVTLLIHHKPDAIIDKKLVDLSLYYTLWPWVLVNTHRNSVGLSFVSSSLILWFLLAPPSVLCWHQLISIQKSIMSAFSTTKRPRRGHVASDNACWQLFDQGILSNHTNR